MKRSYLSFLILLAFATKTQAHTPNSFGNRTSLGGCNQPQDLSCINDWIGLTEN